MKNVLVCSAALVLAGLTPAGAQDAAVAATADVPVVAMPVSAGVPEGHLLVPRNTPIPLTVNNEVSSKTAKEGDTFSLTVAQDVVIDDYVVIPKGTRGVAEITWRTGKGAFGKSAKMEFTLRYIELGNRRIAIEGKHRIEGKGNTGATIGAVVAVGVFGGFVTGKSAVIAQGREFVSHTAEDFTVALATAQAHPQVAVAPVAAEEPAPAQDAEGQAPAEAETDPTPAEESGAAES